MDAKVEWVPRKGFRVTVDGEVQALGIGKNRIETFPQTSALFRLMDAGVPGLEAKALIAEATQEAFDEYERRTK